MNSTINGFLSLPLLGRSAVSISILYVFWWIFGKRILWILSVIPFLLKQLLLRIYLLIEFPVASLHNKYGSSFYKIDDRLSRFGEKVDIKMLQWYNSWHSSKKAYLGRALLIFVLVFTFISLPSLLNSKNDTIRKGESIYLHCEKSLTIWFEKHGWYNHEEQALAEQDVQTEQDVQSESDPIELTLIVSGLKSSLLIRDIPSTNKSNTLDKIHNGDTVVWSGSMVFSEVDKGHVEPWVKVITSNGIEGWTRLYYLHPEQYDDIKLVMQVLE